MEQCELDRYLWYIQERDRIYHKKVAGEPWPWTEDPILQQYRFCDIYRERDKTSLHYQKSVRNRYSDWMVIPATVLYRWFNRISTCDALFNEPDMFGNKTAFEEYMNDGNSGILLNCLDNIPPPHVTGAYIINGAPGMSKMEGVVEYFDEWCETHDSKAMWDRWLAQAGLTLEEICQWLDSDGLGSFMRAQIIADLKYLYFLAEAPDWWTFAMPGPGSSRGLNVIYGRNMNDSWNKQEWQSGVIALNEVENKHFEGHKTITRFHCQDTQNHLCEFSKYTKVLQGLGRPRQVYRSAD